MLDNRIIEMIEHIGFVNKYGKRVYGSAAVLHFMYCPVRNLDKRHIEQGKTFVQNHLCV